MSTTERAAQIRTELKQQGITSRQVSVRADHFSMGSAIDIRVKDPSVSLVDVRKIAQEHESIRRCEFSGEILSGGNRYVTVEYTEDAKKVMAEQYLPAIKDAMAQCETHAERSLIFPINGTEYSLQRPDGWNWNLWGKNCMAVGNCYDAQAIAHGIIWHQARER